MTPSYFDLVSIRLYPKPAKEMIQLINGRTPPPSPKGYAEEFSSLFWMTVENPELGWTELPYFSNQRIFSCLCCSIGYAELSWRTDKSDLSLKSTRGALSGLGQKKIKRILNYFFWGGGSLFQSDYLSSSLFHDALKVCVRF